MSFSKDIKEELSKISNLADKQQVKAELIGYLITNNISVSKGKLRYSTESEYNINRFSKLLNNSSISTYDIEIQGKVYSVKVKDLIQFEEISYTGSIISLNENIREFCTTEILEKALVRGSFLGSGSINNPERIYHLEIILNSEENVDYMKEILEKYDIHTKKLNNTIYIKDGEEISKFLAFIGANSAVLKYEEIRVIRDMRNNVNRLVNCETANLNKIINASLKQVEDIKFIKKMNRFNDLSESLQEIANLRLENPEISLVELGKLLSNPIGKSGVNYRLKSISNFADELRREK